MGKVRLVGRRSDRARCAYCRERVAEEERVACEGCGALTHDACRDELGGCPTLGCQSARSRPLLAREPREERRGRRRRGEGRRWHGRVTRSPPGLLGRIGPYARIVIKSACAAALLVAFLAVVVWGVTHPADVWTVLEKTRSSRRTMVGQVLALIGFCMMGGTFSALSGRWLARVPDLWRRVGELLDDGLVTPMRLRVYTEGSGKDKRTLVDLRSDAGDGWEAARLDVGHFFTPLWLRWRDRARVYVHGAGSGGPYVLEFDDGLLVLLDPD